MTGEKKRTAGETLKEVGSLCNTPRKGQGLK
jgi:hypothetical protein